ncbi:MAG TPA: PTS mannose transporter subunit IIAB, partial [Bacteroidetes bacterium]|nr:PTS mannose transporter subunit IIAB [Bacteroidota bacterium]
ASYLKELPEERRVFVLAEKPDCFLELVKLGLKIDRLNLGGMHYEDGKRRVTDYLYVDDHDVEVLRRLHELGIALQAQDVPGSRPVDVAKALGFA